MGGARTRVKKVLAHLSQGHAATGASLLIYHRVGGGSTDELDVSTAQFREQMDVLADYDVLALDAAFDRLVAGDASPSFVLTFDDGFADVYDHAWPILRDRRLPFTIYVTAGCVGGVMRWAGSSAKEQGAIALTWYQLEDMLDSGLCTIGNHTLTHARPESLTEDELDSCTETVQDHLGVAPRHFAYTWGVPVPQMEASLRARFLTAATGELGRNMPGDDPIRWRRVPVRGSDPLPFFAAKLRGSLGAERAYATIVAGAKRLGVSA